MVPYLTMARQAFFSCVSPRAEGGSERKSQKVVSQEPLLGVRMRSAGWTSLGDRV
jgi:hypothetical protein